MHNKNIFLVLSLFFLYSCGGGGGGADPFRFSVDSDKTLSTNEDINLSGSFSASTNKSSSITYSITSRPTNGSASINSNGTFTYIPFSNFFGEDNFVITFRATEIDENEQPIGGAIVYTRNVDITVNPVNDSPNITITSDFSNYDENTLIFDSTVNVSATISDVDNDVSELQVYANISNEEISGTYNEPLVGGIGQISLNMSELNNAGNHEITFCVRDSGRLSQCAQGFVLILFQINLLLT
jgi:hypothetical protein